MIKRLLHIWLVLLATSFTSLGQIPTGYYATATGTGYTLKTQLFNKIKNHTNNGYTALWTIYGSSDRDHQYENDNSIFDLYSENPSGPDPINFTYISEQCGTYVAQGDCYNREHVIPQSIYNSAQPMVSDAHFVIPTDGLVNEMRSNYPHGKVSTAIWTSLNGSKRGTSAVVGYSGTVFEPLDAFKGDIARMYFYFVTRYENLVATYTNYPMFNGTNTQTFSNAFLNMLLTWHNQDPVSARELERNNAIYSFQNNRNPFIDHPEFVNLIWGGTPNPSTQTITFNPFSNAYFGDAPINLTATASSGLTITYSSSNTNVAVVVGNTLQLIGVGNTIITATQAGNSIYNPAIAVQQPLTVLQGIQTISFQPIPAKTISSPAFQLNATGGASGNPIEYVSSNPSVAIVLGATVSIQGIGTTIITASQAGNTNYAAATNVSQSLTVTNGLIAGWDFNPLPGGTGVNNFGISPFAPSFSISNCAISGLTRGSGIGTPSGNAAAARAWGGTINTTSSSSAIVSNTFITITLKCATGFAMDLNSINPIDYRRSSSGATNALVQYSINSGSFVNLSTLNFTSNSSSGASAGSIDLSTFTELQNIHSSETLTIRIIPYGGTGGTFYFFDRTNSTNYDLSINGNVRVCNASNSIINLSIPSSSTPYSWYGQSLTSTGTYTNTFINSHGCDSVVTLYLTVTPLEATMNIKAFIQGYYIGLSTMQAVIFNSGESNNNLLCDSITLELHSATFPYSIIHNQSCVLDIYGNALGSFPASCIGNSYYLVLKNRNCVETWSASPLLISNVTSYDFSSATTQAFGNNLIAVEPNITAIYNGDINQDGTIDISDYALWEMDANVFATGYFNSDIDGDGTISTPDYSIWEYNSINFVSMIVP